MRTRVISRDAWIRRVLLPLLLCYAGFASCQLLSAPPADQRPPWLAMVARGDAAVPARYIGVFGDELTDAVAIYRDGDRVRTTVPFVLQRGDEIETMPNVIAVLRYDAGDVYIDAATRVRIGSLDVLFGKVFARVRGLFSVENRNVVAGVEGTEFAFEVGSDGRTQVTVLDGNVLCSSKGLPWKPLRVTPGQAFGVADGGRQMQVSRATPAKLAQLRSWVERVDVSVATYAPRGTPPPSVQPPPAAQPPSPPAAEPPSFTYQPPSPPAYQPPGPPTYEPPGPPPAIYLPVPPVVIVPSGYCCDDGRVFRTTPESCRGRFYDTRAEAARRCETPRIGYCCANGRVFESSAQACRGVFSFDQAGVRRSCAPQPLGYCCASGEISRVNRAQCQGSYFTDEASARKSCAAPAAGYCCVGGEISRSNRAQCRGNYFAEEASARVACAPAPEKGYCCVGGKVSQATRETCRGAFARSQSEALRVCNVAPLVPKPDAGLNKEMIRKPAPRTNVN